MINKSLQKILHGIALSGLLIAGAHAQTADTLLAFRFPDLASAINAAEVVHAAILEEIVLTNSSPLADIGKNLLRESLIELAAAKGSHYHTAGDHLAMLGPYRVVESRATPGLLAMLREDFPRTEADQAIALSGALPSKAVAVLQHGRRFQSRLIEIHLDGSILDKQAAVDIAVADYLADDEHSVPAQPKSSSLLSSHPHAYAFRVGFPQLSGLTWASQWLQLATLEVLIMSAFDDAMVATGNDQVMALYIEKIARLHGSLVSLPSDIPTMPVISPNVYSAHAQAAIIIDNLSALKIVLGDILAHPDVADRNATIDAMLVQFTDKENHLDSEIDYLTFVLRGGIYNQGGPAFGGMQYSERNRSRDSVDSPHVSRYPMGTSF